MAVTVINLSDPVSSLVTKTNTISNDLGDVAQLATGDSNVVDAINTIKQLVSPFDDSAEILAIARNGLSINNDSASGLSLSYNTSTGIIKLIGAVKESFASDSANGIGFNFGEGKFGIISSGVTANKIAAGSITSAKFNSATSLIIYDDAGSVVKTIYSPGS